MDCCSAESRKYEISANGENKVRKDRELIALVVSGFLAGNSTLFALVVNLNQQDRQASFYLNTGLLVVTLLVTALLGPPLVKSLYSSVQDRSLTIDALFALGCCGAFGYSLISYLSGTGPVYFEIVSILLVIRAIGNRFKAANQSRVMRCLGTLAPRGQQCRVLGTDGKLTLQSVAKVQPGQTVLVPLGAMIPVDGEVSAGKAFIRESTITGEPHLRSVHPGDRVTASSLTIDGPLQVTAVSRGDQRAVDQIMSAVESALAAPSRLQRQADLVGKFFTPLVALVALSSLVGWWLYDGMNSAVLVALAVLLVACPCAFGFATPVTVWATLARLASAGIVVRRADFVERLAAVNRVIFDKTGTLTTLQPVLSALIIRDRTQWNEQTVASLVRSLEASSCHPIAEAFIKIDVPLQPTTRLEIVPGTGVRGTVVVEDRPLQVEVGSLDQLQRPCCDDRWITSVLPTESVDQQTIGIRVNDQLIAIALVDELPIETLGAGLSELNELGVELLVCSGDRHQRVARLGIEDALGNLSPTKKMERVKSLQREGHCVLFVGDGVNDSAAMATADASISVAHGAELAQAVADANWHGQDLRSIARAISICRTSVSRLRTTLWFAVIYNIVGMAVAASGHLHPVFAVVLMMFSSLFVVLRAANPESDSPLKLGESAVGPSSSGRSSAANRSWGGQLRRHRSVRLHTVSRAIR